jgi:hypothetical protein
VERYNVQGIRRLVTRRELNRLEPKSNDPKDPESLRTRVRVMNYVGSGRGFKGENAVIGAIPTW